MLPCDCNEFVDENGIGACQKRDESFNGKFSCFVDQPNACKDVRNSTTNPERQVSANACEDKNEGKTGILSPNELSKHIYMLL